MKIIQVKLIIILKNFIELCQKLLNLDDLNLDFFEASDQLTIELTEDVSQSLQFMATKKMKLKIDRFNYL